jgi:hypothetical protein
LEASRVKVLDIQMTSEGGRPQIGFDGVAGSKLSISSSFGKGTVIVLCFLAGFVCCFLCFFAFFAWGMLHYCILQKGWSTGYSCSSNMGLVARDCLTEWSSMGPWFEYE